MLGSFSSAIGGSIGKYIGGGILSSIGRYAGKYIGDFLERKWFYKKMVSISGNLLNITIWKNFRSNI